MSAQHLAPLAPPKFLQWMIATLIPPASRDEVLGDLEERYHIAPRGRALLQYLFDAALLVPVVFWRERRQWTMGANDTKPLRTAAGLDAVRHQVAEFQQANYCRVLVYCTFASLISIFLATQVSFAHAWFSRIFGIAYVSILGFTAYQHYVRGSALVVPEAAGMERLIAFHRTQLVRRIEFLRTLWYWKWLPLFLPILAIPFVKRDETVTSAILWMLFSFSIAAVAARREVQGLRRCIHEIDAL